MKYFRSALSLDSKVVLNLNPTQPPEVFLSESDKSSLPEGVNAFDRLVSFSG